MFPKIAQLGRTVLDQMQAAQVDALNRGLAEAEAEAIGLQTFERALNEASVEAIRSFEKDSIAYAEQTRHETRSFENRLYDRWRVPLDRYLALVGLGVDFLQRIDNANGQDAAERQDHIFYALVGICARACRVSHAVHHLLCGGFPLDALSRARTIHELAVAALLISDSANDADNRDLAERFRLHGHISAYGDALVYQENATFLGYEPFSEEEVERMREKREELLTRFGRSYKHDYGWASKLLAKDRPTFRDLEERAELSRLRGYYRWSSQEVHSGPRSLHFNSIDFRGREVRLVNRTNHHLADPAQIALIALMQCLSALLTYSAIDPQELLYMTTMSHYVDETCNSFAVVQQQIDLEEEELLRSREGRN
ncbi:DUF5677 domain-containing protein [Micromonospora sp. NPDC047738]|uniref:DUF5677 domain-containing protein n=1 Tax=Micromonospora sp. NPDC047738 TaxID=3155741 RepID=UPI0033F5A011